MPFFLCYFPSPIDIYWELHYLIQPLSQMSLHARYEAFQINKEN